MATLPASLFLLVTSVVFISHRKGQALEEKGGSFFFFFFVSDVLGSQVIKSLKTDGLE